MNNTQNLYKETQPKLNYSNQELPHDIILEDAIMGGIIMYPEQIHKIESYFSRYNVLYQQKTRKLWEVLMRMKKNKENIDMITVCGNLSVEEALSGLDRHYVIEITTEAPLATNIPLYAQKIYEKYLLREVILSARKIEEKALISKIDVYDDIISSHSMLGELISHKPSDTFNIMSEMNNTIESIKDKDSKLIKTGYTAIDDWAGGLTRGEITIIGGRPGHGKTTFMLNLLVNFITAGYKCILFNRELPNSELLKKLIAVESGKLSYAMIRKGIYDDSGVKELEKVKALIIDKYNKNNLLMFDNLRDFNRSSAEVKKFQPDVILDDYIQLINPTKKIEQRRLQLEALVNDYKWLSKEHKCVSILASQLNRSLEMRSMASKPQLSDLAESGAIEQVAENVFFTYYDYKINGSNSKGKNVVTIVARKVRYGETGETDLGFDGDKARFYNTVEDYTEDLKREMIAHNDEALPF